LLAGAALLAAGMPLRASDLYPFDELMGDFMREHRVPGAALAIARNGRLVYARGFGTDDDTAFRVASLSKPLTAAAVLQLAERGRLALEAGAWELLALPEPADARWKRIQVLHLLQHTGGWDRERSFDPMFRAPAGAEVAGIIGDMLSRPLDFDPGSRDAYSNFGYCLLGRIVERASGMSYGDYVRAEVLAPLGIKRMRLDPDAALDAHSGWIGSAPELVRFASAFDDRDACLILNAQSIERMFARPDGAAGHHADGRPQAVYYGCGWMVRPIGRLGQAHSWHDGALGGNTALLVRGYDRTHWAVLFDARANPDGRLLSAAIDRRLHRAARDVRRWPQVDRFPGMLH